MISFQIALVTYTGLKAVGSVKFNNSPRFNQSGSHKPDQNWLLGLIGAFLKAVRFDCN